jgi:HAD superfamily hydrolase (TIGR01484 family)
MSNAFFFDFDDTLYSHKFGCVPPSTKRCLEVLLARGERVFVATGRGAESSKMIETEIGFCPDVMIMMNGQIIIEKGKVVYHKHITLSSLGALFSTARQLRHAYGGYYAGGTLVNADTERVKQVWRDFAALMPTVIADFAGRVPLYQGHLYITDEEGSAYGTYFGDYVLNRSHVYLVNLIPKNAGKASALRWCLERYGIPWQNTFAFGDGINDVEMLKETRHAVAMGNASPELTQAAEYVTKTASDDGIYWALKYYKQVDFDL